MFRFFLFTFSHFHVVQYMMEISCSSFDKYLRSHLSSILVFRQCNYILWTRNNKTWSNKTIFLRMLIFNVNFYYTSAPFFQRLLYIEVTSFHDRFWFWLPKSEKRQLGWVRSRRLKLRLLDDTHSETHIKKNKK